MTSKYKEMVLNTLETLYTANFSFSEIIELEKFTDVCVACQETAFDIGTKLENTEKNPAVIVSHLENYCEQIYQLSLMFGKSNLIPEQIQKINDVLDIIKKEINSISITREVVFLPYKSSMWDCFHSVYEACKRDSRFQVYVVPIPYYSLDSDGNIESEFYEGNEISKFAEITDYRKYDISDRNPDIIFIHNPYDQYNTITQIPEQYFSSELIKYTEHLVYIPYYVSQRRTDDIMTVMPGVRNSWKTIVQSKEIRQQYIQNGIRENQIEVLGNPKFDMVVKAEIDYRELPEEWSALRGKKVYLYNTHLLGLMSNVDLFLEKILQVMEYFMKRDDVALLWRPHPLSQETLKRYHPEALSSYVKIIEWFKIYGNGIYDDSENLERAIAVSDAYMGDEQSSVSTLYQMTGKPMYYMDFDSNKLFQKERFARCHCAEKIGNKIYMFSWEYNCIFTYDMDRKILSCNKGNDKIGGYTRWTCTKSITYKNFIYFIPVEGDDIIKLNTLTGEKKYMQLDKEGSWYDPVIYKEHLYLFPVFYRSKIPCINLNEDKIYYIDSLYEKQLGNWNGRKNTSLFIGGIVIEDCVWRSSRRMGPYMQKYNFTEQTFEYIRIEGLGETIVNASVYDGKYFWIIAQKRLIKWDSQLNRILDEIFIEKSIDNGQSMFFSNLYYRNEKIWLIPYIGAEIIEFDIEAHKEYVIDCCDIDGFDKDLKNRQAFSYEYIAEEDVLYLLPYESNGIVKIDTNSGKISFINTQYNMEKIMSLMGNEKIFNENMCDLETFLSVSMKYERKVKLSISSSVGEKIWDYVVNNI